MYDLHSKLNEFYHKEVRLKPEDRERLREYKKLNIDRLFSGIDKINYEESKSYPHPLVIEQGSIPMHTANRHEDNDYDIDVAVIFPKEDLPTSAYDSRKLIEDALKKNSGNFSRQPEARTNAVTVWYSEGYHVDFAVYRSSKNIIGVEVYEHAGTDWVERNAYAINEWFHESVRNLSPKKEFGATVEDCQFRKVVRLVKRFTRSRESWSLPGGLIISVLLSECYKSDFHRDDIALVNSIKSLYNRLEVNRQVYNPTDTSKELTEKQKYKYEVNRFHQKLKQAIKRIEKLDKPDCTEDDALNFWHWFFNSDFWKQEKTEDRIIEHQSVYTSNFVEISASLHVSENGFKLNSNVPNGAMKLPKKMWLRFAAKTNIQPPFNVRWMVINEGDEAEAANDLKHEKFVERVEHEIEPHWERTAYKGKHRLICQIEKNGSVIERGIFEVLIKK
jgi:hypothetical protein